MRMTPEQWERVKDLYEAATGRDPSQRDEFLQRNSDDDVVREETRRLLLEHEKFGSLLSTAAFTHFLLRGEQTNTRFASGDVLARRFRIVRFIAAGGMGEVYEVEDLTLDENLAIKTIRPAFLRYKNALERFKREVHLARKVTHPNVCRVFDLFWHKEAEGSAEIVFVSMELLRGETLSDRLSRKGRFTMCEALPLVSQIASGLEAAHKAGVVHGDLKPGNVILVPDSQRSLLRGVITDFGLALLTGTEETGGLDVLATHGLIGTPAYMAPEQIEGKEATRLSDIYSLGLVIYEMTTGEHAFPADTPLASAAKRLSEPIVSPKRRVPELADTWEQTIVRCLQRDPGLRYSSPMDVARALCDQTEIASSAVIDQASQPKTPDLDTPWLEKRDQAAIDHGGGKSKRPFLTTRNFAVVIPGLLFLSVLVVVSAGLLHLRSRERWARNQLIPQVAELVEKDQLAQAYTLAAQAEQFVPDDPALKKLWPAISWSGSIDTTPPGASVFRKNYNSPEGSWDFVGRTPIKKKRFPLVDSEWKFELTGYDTAERCTFPDNDLYVTIDEKGKAPEGMVRVQFPPVTSNKNTSVSLRGLAGFETLPAISLGDYWIDKYEVTNRQFKQFLDQGGYQKKEYWKYEFQKDGRKLPWSEAMVLFQDKTGRPGPATWVQGEYPKREDDFPVTGVSWYEAAAFAEFVGKSLPTIYHWTAAASPQDSASIIPASNFSGKQAARVGSYSGKSWSGAYDLAGNVKEWVLNEASSGKHYVMGGAWDEPPYMFNDADARSSVERSANFGFRCARYAVNGAAAKAAEPVIIRKREFNHEKPVSDQLFNAYKSLYSYDKTPLDAVIESTQQTSEWKREKVTFAAAYGRERIAAYLFLPVKASPPFQVVVYFPGADALRTRSSANLFSFEDFDFIIRSGRAVLFPIYKGTFERGDGTKNAFPNTTSWYRDHVITWSKDLGRSIDYLQSRSDLDHTNLAYEGVSWGAAMGALLPAIEGRLKVAVLLDPGFYLQECLPEVDQLNFAPRVRIPVLMLNGRFDFIFPPESSQEPMFRLLGTPKTQKRRVVYDVGHDFPQNQLIKETLDWLDRYLGPSRSLPKNPSANLVHGRN